MTAEFSGTPPTILIVDDEEDLREAIAFDFRRKKFRVLTASCGNEAMKFVESEHIDIVLTDVRMPNGDGVELLDRIKARNPLLPVVMLITGFADISLVEAYDKGADAVFSKPFDRKAMYESVIKAIQPPAVRYTRKSSRVDIGLSLCLHFLKSDISQETQIRNMGRGGFFAALHDPFPSALEEAEFHMKAEFDPNFTLKGVGLVRWVRKTADNLGPPGCGIEFQHMSTEDVEKLIDLVNQFKTKAFIPKQ